LIAKIIIQKSASTFTSITSAFDQDFAASPAADHGNLSGLADDDHTQYAQKANNLSDLTVAATARTNLGVAIGTDVQAFHAYLADIAGITAAQGDVIYFNGTDWVNLAPGVSGQFLKTLGAAANPAWDTIAGGGDMLAANNLSDVANAATSATNLGLGTGDSPQFTAVNIGHATDTTITRVSAGVIAVEGVTLLDTADIGASVQAFDADTLKADTDDTLSGGYQHTTDNYGTKSSGTYTPTYAGGHFKYAVNGGAHTLAPQSGNGNLVIQYTNNASAGAITTSGFTIVTGDAFTTTDGNDFMCYLTVNNGFSHLNVVALQ
jgi:hypothetical protein